MRLFRQFGVILGVTWIAELMEAVLPLPVPASIYGLLLMLAALLSGVLPLKQVEQAGDFLVEIMPLMFIPAAAGILTSYEALREILLPLAVILVVTTVVVMAVTGRMTQAIIRRQKKKEEEK